MSDDFPPDLAALEKQFGGYSHIPREAWDRYEYDLAQWKIRRGIGWENNYDHGGKPLRTFEHKT
jgi:hypothetical protein